jgi:UDP-N-acetylglucosamine 3-dehydrogenase
LPKRVAVVGFGWMGSNHARACAELPQLELSYIVEPENVVRSLGGTTEFLESIEQISPGSIDLAIVATPTSTHEKVASYFLRLGVPVLVEKPAAHSVESARRLLQVESDSSASVSIGHIERFNPAIQQMKRKIGEGVVGQVFQIATRRQSFTPSRISDVGVIHDLATHDIDLTRWITDSEYSAFYASAGSPRGQETEDLVAVTGHLESGVVVNHIVNWLTPTKERIVSVTGEKGTLVANTLTAELVLHLNGDYRTDWDAIASLKGVGEGDSLKFAFSKTEPLKSELLSFASRADGQAFECATLQEGIKVLEVAEGMIESSRTGIAWSGRS